MSSHIENLILPRLSPGTAIAACLLLMTSVIGVTVAYFAHAQDAQQISIEQKIVTSAITDSLKKLGDALRPNTYWDNAYDNLNENLDQEWARRNLGPYAQDTSDVSALLVISASDEVIYNFVKTGWKLGQYERNPAVSRLISLARSGQSVPPVPTTGLVKIGNQIFWAAASLVVPNDERAHVPLTRRNVELYLRRFDAADISKVQRNFQLSEVTLSINTQLKGTANIALSDAAGKVIGYLGWNAATPGRSFAVNVAPLALPIIFLIGILLWVALRSWEGTLLILERQRADTESLKQEAHSKSVFIASISHELRTPLNAIIGFSGMLLKQSHGPLSCPDYLEYATFINTSGQDLLSRVNDIIELSSIEAHEKPLSIQRVETCFLLNEALEAVRPLAQKKNIILKVDHSNSNSAVMTSVSGVHEILVRLLDNAIKFSHKDGVVEISHNETGALSTFCIRDYGIGIEPELIKSLGKPFGQLGGHLRRSCGGLGLGLAICFGLAQALKIKIAIESHADQGTTVHVCLPRARA